MKWLVLLNMFWAVAGITFDWQKIIELPIWAVPFIVVCPLFPLLLFFVWFILDLKRSDEASEALTSYGVFPYFLALAALPSAVYGVVAIYFYPIQMVFEGFSWLGIASMLWIWVYAAQGFWLLKNRPPHIAALRVAALFLLVSFIIQYQTETLGYMNISSLPNSSWLIEVLGAVAITWLILSSHNSPSHKQ